MAYVVEWAPGGWKASDQIATDDSGDLGSEPLSASETVEVDADCRKQAWARLVAKVYEIDPFVCPGRMGEQAAQRSTSPKFGSEMKVISVIQETEEIRRILSHLVKIAGGRPAIAARLRSHFAQRKNTTIS